MNVLKQSGLPWTIILVFLAFQALSFVFERLNYSLQSQASSPDRRFTLFEFRSLGDGPGHAPYGTVLSLSRKVLIHHPDDGHVLFAGYCKAPLNYFWEGVQKIVIDCRKGSGHPVRTRANIAYGIEIQVRED